MNIILIIVIVFFAILYSAVIIRDSIESKQYSSIYILLFIVVVAISVGIYTVIHNEKIDEKCRLKKYDYVEIDGIKYIKKTEQEPSICEQRLFDELVVYNFNTNIYHDYNCEYSKQCTKNCVYMEKNKAIKLGRHCEVCIKLQAEIQDNW